MKADFRFSHTKKAWPIIKDQGTIRSNPEGKEYHIDCITITEENEASTGLFVFGKEQMMIELGTKII
jgi:hypothetical protein